MSRSMGKKRRNKKHYSKYLKMQQVLNEILKRLKAVNFDEDILCKEYWLKLLRLSENFNEQHAWTMLIDNIEWLVNTGTIKTKELQEWFTLQELEAHGIYSGKATVNNGVAIGIGNATIEAFRHSRVVLFDFATCTAFDTSFVKGFDNSQMELNNCVGDAFNKCKVTAKDHSKVEAWDSADVTLETYSYLLAHDRATHTKTKSCHVVFV